MELGTINGGFNLDADDKKLVNRQRAITSEINRKFIQVAAVFLKTSGKNPISDDWAHQNYLDTDLQDWIDQEALQLHNVGFNLQLGWMDIDIDADDPEFNACMIAALDFNGVDTRFRFGRKSVGYPTHVLVQLPEEEAANFEALTRFEPKEFRIDGKRYHTQLRSYATNLSDKKNVEKQAKQVVMPGSIYLSKKEAGKYDISVWYSGLEIAENVRSIAATTPRRSSFNQVLRSIAFASLLYVIKDQWVEGQRQSTATKVAGWLARVVRDGQAMNNHEVISADVFCPVDTEEIAESLIEFIAGYCGDDEVHMRVRTFRDAVGKLDRNPDAKIPGWPAMEGLVGAHAVAALRTTFTPGSDVSVLTQMAERYLYDDTDNMYIDRHRHKNNFDSYTHEPAQLERRHIDETVMIAGKPKPAFRMFETSKMRTRVSERNLYPDQEPGTVFRVNSRKEIINDDDEDETGSAVFNTWRGWPILPPDVIDDDLLEQCTDFLDKLLALLTCDNKDQIEWVKDWIAWTFQNPGIKQQIAWVVVGGQGVGKSFFGNTFMQSLMGALWGTSSASIIDNKFNVGPFVDKMFVFVDEVKFHNESGTDEVKKLIRSVDVPGMLKYGEGKTFKIYARLMFASNTFDMAIGQKSVLDRALFYTKAYSANYKKLTDSEFRSWSETLKPWFEEFDSFLKRMDARQHFVHMFMTRPVDKQTIESIKYSSSADEEITGANMRPSRRIAKYIIEDCRIHEDTSIEFPFGLSDLGHRITEVSKVLNIKPIRTDLVLAEFLDAGVLENARRGYTFKYRCETLIEKFGESISMQLDKRWDFDEGDRGDNDEPSVRKPWKGTRRGVVQEHKF